MKHELNDKDFYLCWNQFTKLVLEIKEIPEELAPLAEKIIKKVSSDEFSHRLLCDLKNKEVDEFIFDEMNFFINNWDKLKKYAKKGLRISKVILQSIGNIVSDPITKAGVEIIKELLDITKIFMRRDGNLN